MANLSISFTGAELELRRSTSCTGTDSPTVYRPALRTENGASQGPDAGNKLLPLGGPGPHTLPWPGGLAASVLYVRALDEQAAEYTLEITREDAVVDSATVRGMFMQEFGPGKRVTAVSVVGSPGDVEWAAA